MIWVLVAVGLAWYAPAPEAKAAHQDWVFQNGIRGSATVLDAGSHADVNEMPLMKLSLELDVPGRPPPGQAARDHAGLRRHRMEPGLVLPVYVNPQDPDDFVLVW